MRPKRLARLAALVVATVFGVGVTGCGLFTAPKDNVNNNNNYNNNNFPRGGFLLGSKTDTVGSCFRTIDLKSVLAGGFLNMDPAEQRDGFAEEHFAGLISACPARQSYSWSSKNVAVVTAMAVDSTTGRVTGIAFGPTTEVCITGNRDGAQACAPASVKGTAVTVSIGPSGQTVRTGNGCNRTLQMTVSPVGTAGTWSVSSGATINSSTGLLTGNQNASGTATVSFTTPSGTVVTNTVQLSNTDCTSSSCAATGMTATVASGAINVGQSTTFTVTELTNGVAGCSPPTVTVSGPLTVSNLVVSGNVVTGTVTGTGAGTGTILGVSGDGSHSAQATVVVSAVTGSISVAVTPGTFSLIVGQSPITLTCTVSGTPSTACTQWESFFVGTTQSAGTCVSIVPQGSSQNQAIVTPIAGCTQSIEIRAHAAIDVSKYGTSVGSTSSGNVQCVINWNGTTSGTITVAVNQTTPVTASCTNQFGAQFVPYWRSSDGSRVDVVGTTAVYPIGGVNYPAGAQASIKGIFAGQATVTAQAAITDATVLAQRLVVVQ